jgi:tRNA pseudouridine32 synthase/23S rRNA pseudouridine746 synthase
LGHGIIGDRVYGVPGGPMLLHASRLVVPRGSKAPIDVVAPLPEHWGEWSSLVSGDPGAGSTEVPSGADATGGDEA